MDKNKIIEVIKDVENKSNKDLSEANIILIEEFKKTKSLIIDLTRHLEIIEDVHTKVNNELKKRNKL